ncbi:MAG: carbon-nitrogen hydrolase family protein [Oscillospiraceae bacterium]|nr:carbon-nitrogen hydrolase family protein [Oscillospiraceae bacterium]
MKKIAVAQMHSKTLEIANNLAVIKRLVHEAAAQHADIVLLPELCVTGYRADDVFSSLAEPLDGAFVNAFTQLSAENGGIQIYTSVPERNSKGGLPYNTAILVTENGMTAFYRKIHLWGSEVNYFTPGNQLCCAETSIGRAGLMVCFDVSFPEVARAHALGGADALFYTFAFSNPARAYAFDIFTRARALENGCYVAAANMVGVEKDTCFFGSSCIIDPAGNIVADAQNREGVVSADFDLGLLEEVRTRYPYLSCRKHDIY